MTPEWYDSRDAARADWLHVVCRPAVTGLAMKGICEVDDPDQIQACVWHVDKVPADRAKSTPKFQIAF